MHSSAGASPRASKVAAEAGAGGAYTAAVDLYATSTPASGADAVRAEYDQAAGEGESHEDLTGQKWHVIEVGAGAPVVFFHDLFDSAPIWTPVIDSIAIDWRCIAVDLPGHGESDPLAPGTHFDDLLDDLTELFDMLGVIRPVLVGHGLGAALATALDAVTACARAVVGIAPDPLATPARARVEGISDPDFVDTYFPSLFSEAFFHEQPGLAHERRAALERIVADDIEPLAAAIDAADTGRFTPRPGIARATVLAEHDASVPATKPAAFDEGEVVTVPGVGHSVPIEAPRALTKILTDFLQRELIAA